MKILVDFFLVVFACFFSSLIAEGLAWLFIYRTERYQKLTAELKRLNKKIERKRESTSTSGGKKKVKTAEEDLQNVNRSLSFEKMKSDVIIFVGFLVIVLSILSSVFDGRPVAKLPFEPFSFLQGLTHRNLPGTDMTDCSYLFIYVLCSAVFRTNIQKVLGTTPPRTTSLFETPAQ